MSLVSVEEALARVLASANRLGAETISINDAYGRTLAENVQAKRTQPPFNASAMDGYAVRGEDVQQKGNALKIIGESAAGHGFDQPIGAMQAVRIFTGAPVPEGADTILLQENATRIDDQVVVNIPEVKGRHIRKIGLDFSEGKVLLAEGEHASQDQIVASNHLTVAALVGMAGGEAIQLGIAGDSFLALERGILAAEAEGANVLITLGGASVGDHDLVQNALTRRGMELSFWRIAMRPGKPLIHGKLGPMAILGLPGNPVSSYVCARLFLMPLIRAMQGDPDAGRDLSEPAVLGCAVRPNDKRQDYLRASLTIDSDGLPIATPYELQDSSMIRVCAEAGALVLRNPNAPAQNAGEKCRIIRL